MRGLHAVVQKLLIPGSRRITHVGDMAGLPEGCKIGSKRLAEIVDRALVPKPQEQQQSGAGHRANRGNIRHALAKSASPRLRRFQQKPPCRSLQEQISSVARVARQSLFSPKPIRSRNQHFGRLTAVDEGL